MKIIAVDDERIMLARLVDSIKAVIPDCEIFGFMSKNGVIEKLKDNVIDIAFLDIHLNGSDGIELAKQIKNVSKKTNIVFCTGYSDYTMQAFEIYASGYILKPINEDKIRSALENLRFPVSDNGKRVRFNCFGNFSVFCDGAPIRFSYNKTQEMLAYIVDKNGALCSFAEIDVNIFDQGEHSSYLRNLKSDLLHTLQKLGVDDIVIQQRGKIGIDREKVECDYFEVVDGKKSKESFYGKYMSQYPWAVLD